MKEKPRKTSAIIAEIVEDCVEDGTVTVGEFLGKMGNRAQAIAILVLSLSAVVAGIVPGFSTLMAVPIMFIALQMSVGSKGLWLPQKIREKQISPRIVRGALAQSIPSLRWVEKFLRPRLAVLTHPFVERLMALIIVVLAGVLSLPIPGGNFLPSMGISLLAVAMLERDGLFVLAAIALVVLTGGFMIDLIVQAAHLLKLLLVNVF